MGDGATRGAKIARVATQRLEGSRFIILQLYRLAAGGSRERLHVMQFYRESHSHRNGTDTVGKTSRWVILGSRPLTTFVGQILP
jgi:hypothetical protein